MNIHSYIMIKEGSGYRAIYCHRDGSPEGVGRVLAEHYTDNKKVLQLIELGSLVRLGKNIGGKLDFDRAMTDPSYAADQCVANYRDRDDPMDIIDFDRLPNSKDEWEIEYFYVFIDGEWYVYKGDPEKIFKVRDVLEKKIEL